MHGLQIVSRLNADQIAKAVGLIETIALHDGLSPVSEHVFLHLRHGGDDQSLHFLLSLDNELIGYAHLDITDKVEGPITEIALAPQHRQQVIGTELIHEIIGATPSGDLRMWAHGDQSVAGAWAQAMGFRHIRTLWQMRRSLLAPLPPAVSTDDVELRTFRPGQDDKEWVAINALAFAHHGEQGDWTIEDLHQRIEEPWFSIPGFFVAEDRATKKMLGFHWTKVHGLVDELGSENHVHDAIGEVYVVGIDPNVQGKGLGKALTLTGLHHLRSRDLSQCMLYVDATNTSAIKLYEALGFARWDADVMYRHEVAT